MLTFLCTNSLCADADLCEITKRANSPAHRGTFGNDRGLEAQDRGHDGHTYRPKARRAAAVVLSAAAANAAKANSSADAAWKNKQRAESKMEMRALKKGRSTELRASPRRCKVYDDAQRAWLDAEKVSTDAAKAMWAERDVAKQAWRDAEKVLKNFGLPGAPFAAVFDSRREIALDTWLKKADHHFDEV